MVVYRVGEIVQLSFNALMKQGITEEMIQHNGNIYPISKIKSIIPPNKRAGGLVTYYELKGFESEKGVPFAVTIDMIQPVKGATYARLKQISL